MSNLIKYHNFQINNDNKVVIDSNKKIEEKIGGLKEGIRRTVVGKDPFADADGFVSGLSASVVEDLIEEPEPQVDFEAINAQAEAIINDANAQAEAIIAGAKVEAENALAEARNIGYAEGVAKAEGEFKSKEANLEKQYKQRQNELEADYQKKVDNLEPELVDMLLKVFAKVTHTMAEDKKDMIISLINSVMRNTELSRDFFIRVSPEDYKFALNNQDRIYSSVAKDVHIEISEDSTLERNQCIIETDAGVFDCSLDIQLENLIKDIRLLSCMND